MDVDVRGPTAGREGGKRMGVHDGQEGGLIQVVVS